MIKNQEKLDFKLSIAIVVTFNPDITDFIKFCKILLTLSYIILISNLLNHTSCLI